MGKKKGKMSDFDERLMGHGKWAKFETFRNLDQHMQTARKGAYDQKGVESKRLQMLSLTRQKKSFSYLNRLVQERVRDDVMRATLPSITYRSLTKPLNFDNIKAKFQSKLDEYVNTYINIEHCVHNKRSTLFKLSIESIVKNMQSYTVDDLAPILTSLLTSSDAEYLNYLYLKHCQLTDQTIPVSGLIPMTRLYLANSITIRGLESLIDTMVTSHENHRAIVDSWELLDAENVHIFDGRQSIQCIYYLQDCIDWDFLQHLQTNFPFLSELHLIQTALSIQSDWYLTNTEGCTLCLSMLKFLFEGFPQLEKLHFTFCAWINVQAFQQFLTTLQTFLEVTGTLCLTTIHIYGWYDREYRDDLNDGQEEDAMFRLLPVTATTTDQQKTIQELNTTDWPIAWKNLANLYYELLGISLVLETDFVLLEQQCVAAS